MSDGFFRDRIPPARCHTCFNVVAYCECYPSDDFVSEFNRALIHELMSGGLKHDMEQWIRQHSDSIDQEWRDLNA